MCEENSTMSTEAAGSSPLSPNQPLDRILWPHDWWRCLRLNGISGRYDCTLSGSALGKSAMDLRIDVDQRHANSPVMNRVSADMMQVRWKLSGGFPRILKPFRSYKESWIIDEPAVKWSTCSCKITGRVRYWKGSHPKTDAEIVVDWNGGATTATVKLKTSRSTTTYTGELKSHCFRSMNLEVDVCTSVNAEPVLPTYDTNTHPDRPLDLPNRVLTLEECYEEAGICVTVRPERSIIDDSAATFNTWSVGELHDSMETHFSQIASGWPKWEMWGVLVGRFDSSGTAGIMFDAAAAYGGAGEAPDRQGFAVARNHSWFNDLVTGAPANAAQAFAQRQFLYTWVHEAGHAFNFLHSWNKGRPESLSWMNYPQYVTDFWDNFRFRFDDEELIHMRHGDRASVIMGGDAWASGGHLESPALESLMALETGEELEVLLRSRPYFDFMEPVEVEVRLRNAGSEAVVIDKRLKPEFGRVAFLVQRPDGRILDQESIFCQVGSPELHELKPASAGPGEDRYSETVPLSYGKHGFLFAEPGEYRIRAYYETGEGFVIPSNILRVRVGRPFSKEEDRLAQDYFSKGVGLILALGESRSPYLANGKSTLEEIAERLKDSAAAQRIAFLLAQSLTRPFFRIETKDRKVKRVAKAEPEKAVALTDTAVARFRKEKQKVDNLSYHRTVRLRAECLKEMGDAVKAKKEVATLRTDLEARGVHAPVLKAIAEFEKSL